MKVYKLHVQLSFKTLFSHLSNVPVTIATHGPMPTLLIYFICEYAASSIQNSYVSIVKWNGDEKWTFCNRFVFIITKACVVCCGSIAKPKASVNVYSVFYKWLTIQTDYTDIYGTLTRKRRRNSIHLEPVGSLPLLEQVMRKVINIQWVIYFF